MALPFDLLNKLVQSINKTTNTTNMKQLSGPILGFKGFDSKLKCKEFQYEIGKNYIHDKEVRLCGEGFHFASTLTEAFNWYQYNGLSRFCQVLAQDKIYCDTHIDPAKDTNYKLVTNNLTIIKEFTPDEIFDFMYGPTLEYIRKVQERCPFVLVGGSLLLMMKGLIPIRPMHDIDLVIPSYLSYKDVFGIDGYTAVKSDKTSKASAFNVSAQIYVDKNVEKDADGNRITTEPPMLSFDCFINPHSDCFELEWKGHKYQVANAKDTLQAKIKYYFESSNDKHLRDISTIFAALADDLDEPTDQPGLQMRKVNSNKKKLFL